MMARVRYLIFDIENNNSALDIGNQFEFNVDCSLNGPYSRLLKRSISTYIDIQSRGLVFFEMKVAF